MEQQRRRDGAGKPIVVIDGKPYRRSRRYVGLSSIVNVTVTESRKQLVVEVLEPVEVQRV